MRIPTAVLTLSLLLGVVQLFAQTPYKALIVDGQNNHSNWATTTKMMKQYLEQTKLFTVDIARTAPEGVDAGFHPTFKNYKVVVSNYNGADWPKETQQNFAEYVAGGGGFVVVHAANNAFSNWPEYNRMIGIGGWGGRNENSGPFVYYDENGKPVRDSSPGSGGNHGPQHPFLITIRDHDHPVTRNMPGQWMHVNDELYDSLRGPAENMDVLGTAFSDRQKQGTGRHEPMIMALSYDKGRVFHTPMGHGNDSQQCVGFIVTFQRGAEWAASGEVTQEIPGDFPTQTETSSREFKED